MGLVMRLGTYLSLGKKIATKANLIYSPLTMATSPWTTGATTVTEAAASDPEGGSRACRVNNTAVTSTHAVNYPLSPVAGPMTIRVRAKAGTFSKISLLANGTGVNARFDLGIGTVTTVAGSPVTAITPLGDGWYLCEIVFTNATTNAFVARVINAANQQSYLGNVADSVLLYRPEAFQP